MKRLTGVDAVWASALGCDVELVRAAGTHLVTGGITHPDHRGQGLAKALASQMIDDALPAVGIVGRGDNPVAHLHRRRG